MTLKINAKIKVAQNWSFTPSMLHARFCTCCCSIAGHYVDATPQISFYSGTKFAVRAFTEAMRKELRLLKSHVRVCVSPSSALRAIHWCPENVWWLTSSRARSGWVCERLATQRPLSRIGWVVEMFPSLYEYMFQRISLYYGILLSSRASRILPCSLPSINYSEYSTI